MRKAAHTLITSAVQAHPPARLPRRRAANPAPEGFTDPSTLPNTYAMRLDGKCLDPLIPHGTTVVFSKTEAFEVGDFICMWFRPETLPAGARQSWIKRLVMGIMPGIKFPHRDHPKSDVAPVVMCEQLNPRGTYTIPCRDVLAIHKAIGVVPGAREIGTDLNLADLMPIQGAAVALAVV